MSEIILIGGMALVTFAVRYPVLALVGQFNLRESVVRALRYVPVAVLTAITVPAILMPEDTLHATPDNARLIGGAVATLIIWRSGNLLWTIVGGMAAFLLWQNVIVG